MIKACWTTMRVSCVGYINFSRFVGTAFGPYMSKIRLG